MSRSHPICEAITAVDPTKSVNDRIKALQHATIIHPELINATNRDDQTPMNCALDLYIMHQEQDHMNPESEKFLSLQVIRVLLVHGATLPAKQYSEDDGSLFISNNDSEIFIKEDQHKGLLDTFQQPFRRYPAHVVAKFRGELHRYPAPRPEECLTEALTIKAKTH